jgi:hypothetical protein
MSYWYWNDNIDIKYISRSLKLSNDGLILAIINKTDSFVRVYKYNNSFQKWVQLGNDIVNCNLSPTDINDYEYFISLSGDGLCIAACIVGNIPKTYKFNGINWIENISIIIPPSINNLLNNKQITSVSLNNNGTTLAFGCPSHADKGCVFIYNSINNNEWKINIILNGDESQERFGYSIALSGDGNKIVIGAPDNSGELIVQENLKYRTPYSNEAYDVLKSCYHIRIAAVTELSFVNFAVFDEDIAYMQEKQYNKYMTGRRQEGYYTSKYHEYPGGTWRNDYHKTINSKKIEYFNGFYFDYDSPYRTKYNHSYAGCAYEYKKNNNGVWNKGKIFLGDSVCLQYGLSVSINTNGTVLAIGGRLKFCEGYRFNGHPVGPGGYPKIYKYTDDDVWNIMPNSLNQYAYDGNMTENNFKNHFLSNKSPNFFPNFNVYNKLMFSDPYSIALSGDGNFFIMGYRYAYGIGGSCSGMTVFCKWNNLKNIWENYYGIHGKGVFNQWGITVSTNYNGSVIASTSGYEGYHEADSINRDLSSSTCTPYTRVFKLHNNTFWDQYIDNSLVQQTMIPDIDGQLVPRTSIIINDMRGNKIYNIFINSQFNDPGIAIEQNSILISTISDLNVNKLGYYHITYTTSLINNHKSNFYRDVNVVYRPVFNSLSPIIVYQYDSFDIKSSNYGLKYDERTCEIYSRKSNINIYEAGNYNITFEVRININPYDKTIISLTRDIIVVSKKIININGGTEFVKQFNIYNDLAGATIKTNMGVILSNSLINTDIKVNTSLIGSYNVTYSAEYTDNVKRTVIVTSPYIKSYEQILHEIN